MQGHEDTEEQLCNHNAVGAVLPWRFLGGHGGATSGLHLHNYVGVMGGKI